MRTEIKVNATSANLGSGFDIIGMSINNISDELVVSWGDDLDSNKLVTVISGGLFEVVGGKTDETTDNMVYQLIKSELALLQSKYNTENDKKYSQNIFDFSIICHNNIPHSRGLGSSSAAIVSALRAAYRVFKNTTDITPDGINEDEYAFQRGCEIEGHPDNIAPCVYGGVQIAYQSCSNSNALKLAEIKPFFGLQIKLHIFGDSDLKTTDARNVLEDIISRENAINNTRSFGLLIAGLTGGDNELLLNNIDCLHQEQRRSLYPKSMEIVDKGMENGIPTFISGAGTTVISMWFKSGNTDEIAVKFDKVFEKSQELEGFNNVYML